MLPPDVLSTKTTNNFPELIEGVQVSGEVERTQSKKRKIPKGFDGEVSEQDIERMRCMMPFKAIQGVFCWLQFTSLLHQTFLFLSFRSCLH